MRVLTSILVFLSYAALCRAETSCEPNIPANFGADRTVDFYDSAIMAAHRLRPSVPHQWVTTYNGLNSADNRTGTIPSDSLGNVYITGASYTCRNHRDYTTIKYSTDYNCTPSPTQSEQETKSYKDCKIVFASRGRVHCEVYIMNPDGSQQKRLTDLTNSGSWYGSRTRHSCSPDGKRIAFETTSGHVRAYHHIFIMNADGSGQVRLPSTGYSDDSAHSWSPAGKEIAFFRGTDRPAIYRVSADGTGMRRLTDIPVCSTVPSWSPDGNKIAFASYREAECAIHVINADGTQQKRLTGYHRGSISCSWSPDGSKIAYMLSRGPSNGLYVMNADGTEQKKLAGTSLAGGPSPPFSWSAYGKSIAFTMREGRMGEICTIRIDGNEIRNLTENPAHDVSPSWSPDGRKIAFASDRDGNSEIYLMNPDGTEQRRLTKSPRVDLDPCWLPAPEPDP